MTEGYIKFNCNWEKKEIQIPEEKYLQLETARKELFDLGLIGMYPDGIGFGNISVKSGENSSFIITGSATGQFGKLKPMHYAMVNGYDFARNTISCIGLTKASAESLSHAAVYETIPEAGAVVHIHCQWLWKKLLNVFPTTSESIEYGTPEMAEAIQQLIAGMKSDGRVIVMGGHREGILGFGSNLEETISEIIRIHNQYQND